jgi:hypothetical protein
MMQFSKCFVVCSLLASLLMASSANAQLVQVPNLAGFGNKGEGTPFSSSSTPIRYQQLYAASEFPHGGTIDKIMFRRDEVLGGTHPPASFDLQVAFAHAATTVHSASATFAANIGSDFTVVLDGVVTKGFSGPLGQSSFDFVFDVANSFTYNPTRGDLLLQMIVRESGADVILDSSFNPEQFVTTRVFTTDLGNPRGMVGFAPTNQRTYGLVTQFQFVPEPSAVAQFVAMLLLLSANRRVKRPL